LEIFIFSLNKIVVRKGILKDKKYDYIFSVNTLNNWVKKGMPFRDAYEKMKNDITKGKYKPSKNLNHSHIGSINNLSLDKIEKKMDNFF
jgi:argininosuccinate lyase